VDYIYEQPSEELFAGLIPSVCFVDAVSRDDGVGCRRTRGAHGRPMDSATNNASDMIDALTLHHESRAPGAITRRSLRLSVERRRSEMQLLAFSS